MALFFVRWWQLFIFAFVQLDHCWIVKNVLLVFYACVNVQKVYSSSSLITWPDSSRIICQDHLCATCFKINLLWGKRARRICNRWWHLKTEALAKCHHRLVSLDRGRLPRILSTTDNSRTSFLVIVLVRRFSLEAQLQQFLVVIVTVCCLSVVVYLFIHDGRTMWPLTPSVKATL